MFVTSKSSTSFTVQRHSLSCSVAPFSPFVLVAALLKMDFPKRVPCLSRVTEQLSSSHIPLGGQADLGLHQRLPRGELVHRRELGAGAAGVDRRVERAGAWIQTGGAKKDVRAISSMAAASSGGNKTVQGLVLKREGRGLCLTQAQH